MQICKDYPGELSTNVNLKNSTIYIYILNFLKYCNCIFCVLYCYSTYIFF